MANPSLKNGYISVATELVERFALSGISGSEWRILWTVWRKTWGWSDGQRKKDWDVISYSQFEKATGMKHANVVEAVQKLVVKRLLLKSDKGFKFNQDYDSWKVEKRKAPVVKRLPQKVVNRLQKPVVNRLHTIDTPKDKRKKGKPAKPAEVFKVHISPQEMQKIVDMFEPINPAYKSFFKNTTERKAINRTVDMLSLQEDKKTYDGRVGLRKIMGILEALPEMVAKPYAPKITTPFQLYKDLGKLILFFKQEKAKEASKGKEITSINNITSSESID